MSEISENQPEHQHSPEFDNDSVDVIDIYLQRHGQRGPDGWLTDEGVEQVKDETQGIVDQYIGPGKPPVTFFILNSPSATFIDGQPAGKRAEHSGRVSAEVIEAAIGDGGQAELHEFGKSVAGTRLHDKLSEPNYFYVDEAENPTAYFDALIEVVGKEGREEGYFQGVPELESLRRDVGAESSPDVAQRTLNLVKVIDRYSRGYHTKYPDRKMVFLLESHGDVIRSTVQHGLGIEASQGWQPDTGQAVEMKLKNGDLSMNFNGMDYEVELG